MPIAPLALDAAAIRQAVSRLVDQRPAYKTILAFYGQVFASQAEALAVAAPEAIHLDSDQAAMRRKEGFALIEPAGFPIEPAAATALLARICRMAVDTGAELAGAAAALLTVIDAGGDLGEVFADVLANRGAIGELAAKVDVSPDQLTLLLYLAIRPGIEVCAGQLAASLPAEPTPRASCPICGQTPILGELDDDGRFWAHCSLCWHRWPARRLACLNCDNANSARLEYFFSEGEPEYRVNLCGVCRHYLKVVDTRKLDRPFHPPLEQVASLHLDLLAAEKGYHRPGAGNVE